MNMNFLDLANKTFNNLFDFLNEQYSDLDVDFVENNLSIEFDDKTFVISIHEPTSQIWLSSPFSGAHHFNLKDPNDLKSWYSTRNEETNLFTILEKEIKAHIYEN